jgi:methylglyoxal synthase
MDRDIMINIALIAHDGKKPEMVSFVLRHKEFLDNKNVHIYATGTTGGHIEKEGIKVTRLLSGPQGGDAQIAAFAAEKKVNMVIFFRDPLDKHPHEPDVQMLMRICDVHNVPLATNPAAADLFITALKKE